VLIKELIGEGVEKAYKKKNNALSMQYRCTTGSHKGKVVSNPTVCNKRKDPKKVRAGKSAARLKKVIRIEKSRIAKKTSLSRLLTRLNKANKHG